LQAGPTLHLTDPRSLAGLLRRLGISYKRGREYVHSPDPDYTAKLAWLRELQHRITRPDGPEVLLFQDECTYYRQPTVAPAYAGQGTEQALARRSHAANTATRIAAALDAVTGRVVAVQKAHITVAGLVAFYRKLRAAYPAAQRLYVVQDNWPVHFHPDVLVALEPQETPFPYYRPGNWPTVPSPTAQRRWGDLQLPIQLVPLPTYASWLNYIEKLWRWGRQEVLHLHPWADCLPTLRREFLAFLAQFADGSQALLRYVGLLSPG
jgi:hypothetical protein